MIGRIRGSILLLCLVFMAALSVSALAAMHSAWSSQQMVSAYLAHHRALITLERALEETEATIWQHWSSNLSLAGEHITGHSDATIVMDLLASAGQLPGVGECQSLFALSGETAAQTSAQIVGRASVHIYWDICCDQTSGCTAAGDYRRVRYWSRNGFSN